MRLRVVELGRVTRDSLATWSFAEGGSGSTGSPDPWSLFETLWSCCQGPAGEVSVVGRMAARLLLEWRQGMAEVRKESEEGRQRVHLKTKQVVSGDRIL